MDLAIIIPAQVTNKYHRLGDLAPFGDTTLLEWKISQCKEFASNFQIYINSTSEDIAEIARKENVNFILRGNEDNYSDILINVLNSVTQKQILWTNPTSPFIGYQDYTSMINTFYSSSNNDSLVSVSSKNDYIYYKNKRLNFGMQFSNRNELDIIQIVTNGCYIIEKKLAISQGSLYGELPYLYDLDYLSSVEIKDVHIYQLSKELISSYFKRDLNV